MANPNTYAFSTILRKQMENLSGVPRNYDAKSPQRLIFDATNVTWSGMDSFAMDTVRPYITALPANSRLVFITRDRSEDSAFNAGMIGFVRSLAKEIGSKGSTANLVNLTNHEDLSVPDALLNTVSFLLTPDSCFVSGQQLVVDAALNKEAASGLMSSDGGPGLLHGKWALVTGAARGIGAAIADRFVREGARVLSVDVPSADAATLDTKDGKIKHTFMDITASDAPARLLRCVQEHTSGGKLDIVVHNAGITKDKTLKNMKPEGYKQVLEVNLKAIRAINCAFGIEATSKSTELALNAHGSVLLLSSINGIAGAAGQTNYSYTKAALMGYAADLAKAAHLRSQHIRANAVAPGFIETAMVAKMPWLLRNMGRRSNALQQGGLPDDIAAVATFLSSNAAHGISGQTLRVCGLNMVGR